MRHDADAECQPARSAVLMYALMMPDDTPPMAPILRLYFDLIAQRMMMPYAMFFAIPAAPCRATRHAAPCERYDR